MRAPPCRVSEAVVDPWTVVAVVLLAVLAVPALAGPPRPADEAEIRAVLAQFTGEIEQIQIALDPEPLAEGGVPVALEVGPVDLPHPAIAQRP